MGYRGADLDLRTLRTWGAASTDLMSGFDPAPQGARPLQAGPIWVDETLLACANHAFDVALAHRSGEVRLEHLLHALTRVEAAAAALESRGVRVLPLRRDAAIVIASEIPVGLSEEAGRPRRSPELEDALRLAAAHAAHAGRPAGVDHLLHVLIDLRSDLSGTELLLRHLARPSRDFWSPLSPRSSPYAGAAHFLDVPEGDRPRNSASTAHLARPARRAEQRSGAEYTILQGMLERLAEIEQAMSERLAAVEAALAGMPGAAPRDLEVVNRRLDMIEKAVVGREGDGTLEQRLSTLEESLRADRSEKAQALSSLAADVKALATALGCSGADGETPSIAQRLQLLAADLEQHRIELGSSLGDRIAAIEKALEAHGEKATESHTAYGEELAEVHEAIMKLNLNQHTLAGSMEQWRSNDAGEIHLINARIGAMQEDGARRLQLLERLCTDVEALSPSPPGEKAPRRGFRYWLFGTDDWVKASWRPRSKPKA
jgi:hypothetical protein